MFSIHPFNNNLTNTHVAALVKETPEYH